MANSALTKFYLTILCGGILICRVSSECVLPKKAYDLQWTKLMNSGTWYSRYGTSDILGLGNVCSSFKSSQHAGLILYTIQSLEPYFPSYYDIPTSLTPLSKGVYSMVALPPYEFIFTGHIGDEILHLTDSETYLVTITCLQGVPSINIFTSGHLRNFAAEIKAFKEIIKVGLGNVQLGLTKCSIF